MSRALFALFATCAAAVAQETWGGLKFGMTQAEALEALQQRATKDVRGLKSEQPVNQKD